MFRRRLYPCVSVSSLSRTLSRPTDRRAGKRAVRWRLSKSGLLSQTELSPQLLNFMAAAATLAVLLVEGKATRASGRMNIPKVHARLRRTESGWRASGWLAGWLDYLLSTITFLFSRRSPPPYSIRLLKPHLARASLCPTSAAMQIRSDEQNHISRFSPLFEAWQFIRDSTRDFGDR